MEAYQVGPLIGTGQFSKVHQAVHKATNSKVALKLVSKNITNTQAKTSSSTETIKNSSNLASLRAEVLTHRNLKHPNIIRLLACFESELEVIFVKELCSEDYLSLLKEKGRFSIEELESISKGLVDGLGYLHEKGIIHRDLKLQNILNGLDGNIKICDFGFARAENEASSLVVNSIKGTPIYMAPELINEKPYNHLIDLWALGIILYELYTGLPPFYTTNIFKLVDLILKEAVTFPPETPTSFKNLVTRLLEKDQTKRLDWPDLAIDPFFTKGEQDEDRDIDELEFEKEFNNLHKEVDGGKDLVKQILMNSKGLIEKEKQGRLFTGDSAIELLSESSTDKRYVRRPSTGIIKMPAGKQPVKHDGDIVRDLSEELFVINKTGLLPSSQPMSKSSSTLSIDDVKVLSSASRDAILSTRNKVFIQGDQVDWDFIIKNENSKELENFFKFDGETSLPLLFANQSAHNVNTSDLSRLSKVLYCAQYVICDVLSFESEHEFVFLKKNLGWLIGLVKSLAESYSHQIPKSKQQENESTFFDKSLMLFSLVMKTIMTTAFETNGRNTVESFISVLMQQYLPILPKLTVALLPSNNKFVLMMSITDDVLKLMNSSSSLESRLQCYRDIVDLRTPSVVANCLPISANNNIVVDVLFSMICPSFKSPTEDVDVEVGEEVCGVGQMIIELVIEQVSKNNGFSSLVEDLTAQSLTVIYHLLLHDLKNVRIEGFGSLINWASKSEAFVDRIFNMIEFEDPNSNICVAITSLLLTYLSSTDLENPVFEKVKSLIIRKFHSIPLLFELLNSLPINISLSILNNCDTIFEIEKAFDSLVEENGSYRFKYSCSDFPIDLYLSQGMFKTTPIDSIVLLMRKFMENGNSGVIKLNWFECYINNCLKALCSLRVPQQDHSEYKPPWSIMVITLMLSTISWALKNRSTFTFSIDFNGMLTSWMNHTTLKKVASCSRNIGLLNLSYVKEWCSSVDLISSLIYNCTCVYHLSNKITHNEEQLVSTLVHCFTFLKIQHIPLIFGTISRVFLKNLKSSATSGIHVETNKKLCLLYISGVEGHEHQKHDEEGPRKLVQNHIWENLSVLMWKRCMDLISSKYYSRMDKKICLLLESCLDILNSLLVVADWDQESGDLVEKYFLTISNTVLPLFQLLVRIKENPRLCNKICSLIGNLTKRTDFSDEMVRQYLFGRDATINASVDSNTRRRRRAVSVAKSFLNTGPLKLSDEAVSCIDTLTECISDTTLRRWACFALSGYSSFIYRSSDNSNTLINKKLASSTFILKDLVCCETKDVIEMIGRVSALDTLEVLLLQHEIKGATVAGLEKSVIGTMLDVGNLGTEEQKELEMFLDGRKRRWGSLTRFSLSA